jgi:hypothetical protein
MEATSDVGQMYHGHELGIVAQAPDAETLAHIAVYRHHLASSRSGLISSLPPEFIR